MRYQGSEARSLDFAERGQLGRNARPQAQAGPSLEVVEGAGLDARVRRGASQEFWTKVRIAVVAFSTLMVLGFARVALYSATLSTLQVNQSMRTQIRTARSTENDLKVTTSMLSSSSRIERIATQNYGMALASATVSEQGTSDEVSGSTSGSTSTEAGAGESYDEGSDQTYDESTVSYDESSDVTYDEAAETSSEAA